MSAPPSRLPAAPLARMIDRLLFLASEGDPDGTNDMGRRRMVYDRLQTDPRVVADWRNQPNRQVALAAADRVLTASPFLWFDVWPECDHGSQHHAAIALDGVCPTCETYYRARWAFTGVRPPRRSRRSRARAAA